MRLYEITTAFQRKPDKKYSKKFKIPQNRTLETGKKGAYSKVKDDRFDPSIIHKYNYIPVKSEHKYDPYWLYVDYIIGSRLHETNPYFPKFYVSQTIKDVRNFKVRKLTMERLDAHETVSSDELERYLMSALKEDWIKKIFVKPRDGDLNVIWTWEYFCNAIEYTVKRGGDSPFKDEQLNEAIREMQMMLRSFANYYSIGTGVDLHSDNIMIRRTGGDIQPVITDPFFNKNTLAGG